MVTISESHTEWAASSPMEAELTLPPGPWSAIEPVAQSVWGSKIFLDGCSELY